MVVIQGRCEECEELTFGDKCRNPECIKRRRVGSMIWGGKGSSDVPIYHAIGTMTTTGEVDSSLTFPDVTLPAGACVVVAVAGHKDTLPSISSTWNGDAFSEFAPRRDTADLSQQVDGLANVSAGTGDLVVSFGGTPVAAVVIAAYVTGVDPDPLDDFNADSNIGTQVVDVNIEIFNFPSIFLYYAATLEPITNPIGIWGGSPSVFIQRQRDGTTGAALSLDTTCSEASLVASSGFDYYVTYGPFSSTEWCAAVITLKARGNNPGGIP